jgi:hydroxyisourate hydrolase
MARISTHVLDTSLGAPAQGMAVELHLVKGPERRLMAAVVTNDDGRTEGPLVSADALETGVYELSFHAADYFHSQGMTQPVPPFLGVIVIRVGIADPFGNYHVPLLLSPFAYSTYRGS